MCRVKVSVPDSIYDVVKDLDHVSVAFELGLDPIAYTKDSYSLAINLVDALNDSLCRGETITPLEIVLLIEDLELSEDVDDFETRICDLGRNEDDQGFK